MPEGDITKIDEQDIPNHDILLAGFPCQPFSIIDDKQGFADTRGTLFFDIERILSEQKPAAFLLENVRQLLSHDAEFPSTTEFHDFFTERGYDQLSPTDVWLS